MIVYFKMDESEGEVVYDSVTGGGVLVDGDDGYWDTEGDDIRFQKHTKGFRDDYAVQESSFIVTSDLNLNIPMDLELGEQYTFEAVVKYQGSIFVVEPMIIMKVEGMFWIQWDMQGIRLFFDDDDQDYGNGYGGLNTDEDMYYHIGFSRNGDELSFYQNIAQYVYPTTWTMNPQTTNVLTISPAGRKLFLKNLRIWSKPLGLWDFIRTANQYVFFLINFYFY